MPEFQSKNGGPQKVQDLRDVELTSEDLRRVREGEAYINKMIEEEGGADAIANPQPDIEGDLFEQRLKTRSSK